MREIRCVQCGRLFLSDKWNASLCSDECRKIRNRDKKNERQRADREGMIDNRRKPPKFKSTMKQLTKDAVEAKKKGVTYGTYMAIYKDKARKDMKWDMEFSRIKKEIDESRRRHNESSGVKG